MHTDDLVRCVQRHGWEVHYLALCSPVAADLSGTAVDNAYFPECDEYAPAAFDDLPHPWEIRVTDRTCRTVEPDVVVADYSWMAGIFDCSYFRASRGTRKTVLAHDLRIRIMPSLVRMGLLAPEANPWTADREGALLAKADAVLTLNEEDRHLVIRIAPQIRALKMGMSVAPRAAASTAAIPGRCLYVASRANENVFAVMWLLKYAWPRVIAAEPRASLAICGSVCDLLAEIIATPGNWLGSLEGLNVLIEGRKENLQPSYEVAQVALVPHWMDGGIKIKHLEAIAHGLPVVCTPAGADGLPEAVNRSALIGEMPEDFADQVIRLLKDATRLETARRQTRDLALRLTPDSVYGEVIAYLQGA